MWGKIIELPDLGCCFVTLKPHIYYCNIFLWIVAILYHGVRQKYLFRSEIHRITACRKLNLLAPKCEWHVSVTAVLNFPLEVWHRTLHRAFAVKNARQQSEYFQFSCKEIFTVLPCILILLKSLFTNWCTIELL